MVSLESKREYVKWYRITQQTLKDERIAPALKDEDIINLISREDWLPTASLDLHSKEALRNSPDPNIYISLYEEKPKIDIGLVFNTVNSIGKIKNILTPYSTKEKTELVQLLRKLDEKYETRLYRKIQDYHFSQSPDYKLVLKIPTNKINDEFIERIFGQLGEIRKDGVEKSREARVRGKFYRENPTITLAIITIDLNEEEYKKRIEELTEILKVCIGIKTDAEIKVIKKEENEQIKNRLADLIKKRVQLLERYYVATAEDAAIILQQIKQIEEQIKPLESIKRKTSKS